MPPLTQATEIRRRLAPKQLILSFHWNSAGLQAALESHDRVATWQVRQPAAVAKEIAALAKSLCLFDPIAPVPTERLLASDWQAPAERIERLLFENSKVELAEGIDELVIVPDGWLWYVPFELLPIGSAGDPAGDRPLLRDLSRVRYAPTRSLAVMPRDDRGPGPVGLQLGRIARGEKEDSEASADAVAGGPAAVEEKPSVVVGFSNTGHRIDQHGGRVRRDSWRPPVRCLIRLGRGRPCRSPLEPLRRTLPWMRLRRALHRACRAASGMFA
jgi:hypothetical protein